MKKAFFLLAILIFVLVNDAWAYFGPSVKGSLNSSVGNIRSDGEIVDGLNIHFDFENFGKVISNRPLETKSYSLEEINGISIGFTLVPPAKKINGILIGFVSGGMGKREFVGDNEITGISIGWFGSLSGKLTGLAMGGINMNKQANGVQIGGMNFATELRGVQIAGFMNLAGNIAEELRSAQIGAINMGNWTSLQLGAINARNMAEILAAGRPSIQIGVINYGKIRGIQVGIINIAQELHGIQIGLFNYAGNNNGFLRFVPVINWHFGG